ncbi:ribose-phosphate pyrophosphokinase [Mariprofundus micogutta]|uniref:Ribose-phosphate pyrophosphokinase n=1 Tax=Mariprofundus micogutta TaxID=1921010 RepID=A0A1L8CJN2_9PROT|nr:ribose-phosphate diphosphokinase [Mariprofundus micogutta]GAV19101.1 ribose-phosphate pyrophosphokinase [Mariprofundus micogutta]
MNNHNIVLGFSESLQQAQSLAAELGFPCDEIRLHRFPDAEHRLQVPGSLPENVILFLSLDYPNEKLIELLLAAGAVRENGATRLLLVAPYLCYMRQDIAFHEGEAVSQQIIGKLLADTVDAVITVDPHLHRITRLQQAVPLDHALALTAAEPMAAFLAKQFEKPLLIGPDDESRQWVESIASGRGFDFTVATKERFGDRNVRIHLPEDKPVVGRDVVIVDDIASTGRTIIAAAQSILAGKPKSLSVLVTHALFAGDAETRIRELAVDHIWSTDSIKHPTNAIPLTSLLADGVRSVFS